MTDASTGAPRGVHRTALTLDGKKLFLPGVPSKMMLGPAHRACIRLHSGAPVLGIAEGIETALSARSIFQVPVWAAMSAGGIRDFPVIYGIKQLRIFADHDDTGREAARACRRRYKAAGIEVEVRYPPTAHSDWNDFCLKEANRAD